MDPEKQLSRSGFFRAARDAAFGVTAAGLLGAAHQRLDLDQYDHPNLHSTMPILNEEADNILLCADPHIADTDTPTLMRSRALWSTKRLVSDLGDGKFDAAAILGDIGHETGNETRDLSNLQAGIEAWDTFLAQSIVIGGNHDFWISDDQTKIRRTIQESGKGHELNGILELKYCAVVWLGDLTVTTDDEGIQQHGTFSQSTIEWFLANTTPARPIVLLVHYPFHPLTKREAENTLYFPGHPKATALQNGEEIFTALSGERNIRAVIAGHCHETRITKIGATWEMVVPSMSERAGNNGWPNAYATLAITPEAMDYDIYSWGKRNAHHQIHEI